MSVVCGFNAVFFMILFSADSSSDHFKYPDENAAPSCPFTPPDEEDTDERPTEPDSYFHDERIEPSEVEPVRARSPRRAVGVSRPPSSSSPSRTRVLSQQQSQNGQQKKAASRPLSSGYGIVPASVFSQKVQSPTKKPGVPSRNNQKRKK
jgi:hypothetical protein